MKDKMLYLDQIQEFTGIQAGLCECDFDTNDAVPINCFSAQHF